MAQPRFSLEQGRYVMSPNQMTYFANVRQPGDPFDPAATPEPYRGAPYMGAPGQVAPRGEFAIGRNVKTGELIEPPPENVSENYQGGYYRGPMPGTEGKGPVVDQKQTEEGGDREYVDSESQILREMLKAYNDPDRLRRQLEATEGYHTRIAQKAHRMGLANIEAAGKAAFNYKYAPQMFMTAAASRAAYYPEMVRAASESFTGLNLANAAKPRMSGYFRGIV